MTSASLESRNWLIYPVRFRLFSPLHSGRMRVGNVQRCRPYLTGRNFWGALTERLTRNSAIGYGPATKSSLYRRHGELIHQTLAYTYFFPAVYRGNDYHIIWPWTEESMASVLQSYASTALVSPQHSAKVATLHEVEYLSPFHVDTGEQIFLVGYVFELQHAGQLPWREAIRHIQFGGERSYGWGEVELAGDIQPTNDRTLFGGAAHFVEIDGAAGVQLCSNEEQLPRTLAHTQTSCLPPTTGIIEPVVGREWKSESSRWRFSGQFITYLAFAFAPGAVVKQEHSLFVIGNYGIWKYVPLARTS